MVTPPSWRTAGAGRPSPAAQAAAAAGASSSRAVRAASSSSGGRCERSISSMTGAACAATIPAIRAHGSEPRPGGRCRSSLSGSTPGASTPRRQPRLSWQWNSADVAGARGDERGEVRARRVGGDVQVAEVEQHPGRRRVEAAHEVADRERVVAPPPLPGVHRRQVLDRDDDAKGMRPLEERDEGPLLEQGALAEARGRRAVGFHEVEAVVGDELGAAPRPRSRAGRRTPGRARACRRSGRPARAAAAAGRCGRARRGAPARGAAPARRSARIARRRRVDLDPREAGALVGGRAPPRWARRRGGR